MKIERVGRLVYVTLPSGNRYDVTAEVAEALIRRGMEAQQKNLARFLDDAGLPGYMVRFNPILDAEVTIALEKANGLSPEINVRVDVSIPKDSALLVDEKTGKVLGAITNIGGPDEPKT